ncbi:cobalt-precorrin-4 C(11)-methyltransferase [Oxobacter pfennigii]|uniref:Cobalt-precorrin-4 C(11)-methyltransferase n=1 Tax=Oxobacter pfennigii TaxID=36849 RepID=A0A0P9AIY8_9CLOT|nr:precorrin-4 C(11)-methyltransferase [Oxobacter pfennigii]KPU45409.1 cobalt-precorrin-4 C(11)-methyltransferase [Oxobacter pfennigii]
MISFVGAGPGDVDLISVKGRKLLQNADIVIYAGSLVSNEHLQFCKEGCGIYDSASMTLEEVIDIIKEGSKSGKKVVRLHTGDPTIYGAIKEQMDLLDKDGIEYEVIPGVSSFTASCAAIKSEFTLPGVSQTVIITRMEGRTPVPGKEDLERLASIKASMAIFLSVQDIEKVVQKLAAGYGSDNVPIAVIYKATWKEQRIIKGTLKDIAEKVKEANIKNFAQILVGYFIDTEYERSLLYHPEFTHGFREGKS